MEKPSSVQKEYFPDSDKLYLIFGGIAAGIAMPPFEFYQSAKILNENKIFFRDFNQSWYQCGLDGISDDLLSTTTYIENEIKLLHPKKIFLVGNSMGGYASIMFSSLLERESEVIAFSPQTFISPIERLRFLDYRWQREIFKTYVSSFSKPKVWNLKSQLKKYMPTRISIFVSKVDRLDSIHANYIGNMENVSVFKFSEGGHGVVKLLRDRGVLKDILSGQYFANDS